MKTRISNWTILTLLLLAATLLLGSPSARAQAFAGCFKDTSVFDLNGYLERSAQNTPQRRASSLMLALMPMKYNGMNASRRRSAVIERVAHTQG